MLIYQFLVRTLTAMPRTLVSPASLSAQERQFRSKLHQLLNQSEGFLHGSLIVMTRRCGKPSCRCASDDEAKHRSLCLGQTLNGKTTMIHIPAHLEPTVRQWVDNHQQAIRLFEQLSQQGRERLKRAKATGTDKTAAPPASSHKAAPSKPPRTPSTCGPP